LDVGGRAAASLLLSPELALPWWSAAVPAPPAPWPVAVQAPPALWSAAIPASRAPWPAAVASAFVRCAVARCGRPDWYENGGEIRERQCACGERGTSRTTGRQGQGRGDRGRDRRDHSIDEKHFRSFDVFCVSCTRLQLFDAVIREKPFHAF
jgi:hypothetical protein